MARIAGVDLPRNKRIDIALTYVHGIGKTTAKKMLSDLDISPETKSDQLSEEIVAKIREYLEKGNSVEGDLRRKVGMNIKRLIDLHTYRGLMSPSKKTSI